eukprot:6087466-Pyramimonas_sp.AAC.2
MERSACLSPALRQERKARSLYLLAHTPVIAAHACAHRAGPSSPGQGNPPVRIAASSASTSTGGACATGTRGGAR